MKTVPQKKTFVQGMRLCDYMKSMQCESKAQTIEQNLSVLNNPILSINHNFIINQADEDADEDISPKPNFQKLEDSLKRREKPVKREMFRSLYGKGFLQAKTQRIPEMLSTQGIHQFKIRTKSLTKKQAELKDKHKKQYQQLLKHQYLRRHAFQGKIKQFCIKGVKDKIHQRIAK